MPKCQTSPQGPAFEFPPATGNAQLDAYLLALHVRLFGTSAQPGDLDHENVNGAQITGVNHANLINVLPYQHHGAGSHADLDQAAAVADADTVSAPSVAAAAASTVAIASADADATYSANEVTLINELKADVNTLVTDVNAIRTVVNTNATALTTVAASIADSIAQLNALLASLRVAKVVA